MAQRKASAPAADPLAAASAVGSSFNERFAKFLKGHWLDSMGNSVLVASASPGSQELTAVVTPLADYPGLRDQLLDVRSSGGGPKSWQCGPAVLEWFDEERPRVVWVNAEGMRSIWSRAVERAPLRGRPSPGRAMAFPWRLHGAEPKVWRPLDFPRDILHDSARIAAILDIRQLIGGQTELQERLTHILMDHDITSDGEGDYLIPSAASPAWDRLQVSAALRNKISLRIRRIQAEPLCHRLCWNGDTEIWVGRHKIGCLQNDIQTLQQRWAPTAEKEEEKEKARMQLEIARLLALYSLFDNPLSDRRNGVHLGLPPEIRQHCDFELFASPLNATVPNGRFASKWPHIEWRFGSIGKYPEVVKEIPMTSVVCVNPPFTEEYLSDVMERLAELKLRFRLRISIPIQDSAWRKKLLNALPAGQLLTTYYDATSARYTELCHPTLFWEDPKCPARQPGQAEEDPAVALKLAEAPMLPRAPQPAGAAVRQAPGVRQALCRAAQEARELTARWREDQDQQQGPEGQPSRAADWPGGPEHVAAPREQEQEAPNAARLWMNRLGQEPPSANKIHLRDYLRPLDPAPSASAGEAPQGDGQRRRSDPGGRGAETRGHPAQENMPGIPSPEEVPAVSSSLLVDLNSWAAPPRWQPGMQQAAPRWPGPARPASPPAGEAPCAGAARTGRGAPARPRSPGGGEQPLRPSLLAHGSSRGPPIPAALVTGRRSQQPEEPMCSSVPAPRSRSEAVPGYAG